MQQQRGSVARPHRGVAGRPALLRRHPDPTSDYSSSHLGRGEDHDEDFAALRFRAVIGFEVVARRSLGLLPASEERVYGVPEGLAHRVEWFNLRHLSAWHAGGSNTIWLLRRNLAGH
jgi:hypothetical protein